MGDGEKGMGPNGAPVRLRPLRGRGRFDGFSGVSVRSTPG